MSFLEQALDAIRRTKPREVVFFTGAGVSAESGIPTFRGAGGLWRNFRAEDLATPAAFERDPQLVLEWYEWRRGLIRAAEPNAAHEAIARMPDAVVVTQNVDGLHLKAGTDPNLLIEVHGNTREVMCMQCDERAPMERALARVRAGEEDPPCRTCGGLLKSATISFGQNLVEEDLIRADWAARNCDLLLAVGSTLGVYPAAGVVPIAKRNGARLVILNAEPTEMDDLADAVLRGSIAELLPPLVGMSTR